MAPARVMVLRVFVGLLAILFMVQGTAKLAGVESEKKAFTERWGYPLWFMYAIGTLEVAGAIGLPVARLRPWAALGLMGLMLGAISTHVRVSEWTALPLPLFALGLATWVAWQGLAGVRGRFGRTRRSSD